MIQFIGCHPNPFSLVKKLTKIHIKTLLLSFVTWKAEDYGLPYVNKNDHYYSALLSQASYSFEPSKVHYF